MIAVNLREDDRGGMGVRNAPVTAWCGRLAVAFALVACAVSAGACRRSPGPAPTGGQAAEARLAPAAVNPGAVALESSATGSVPPCETTGQINLRTMTAIPELARITTEWVRGGSNELAAALRDGGIDPLEGMDYAQICQTSRRTATGGHEVAVTLVGKGTPELFARTVAPARPGAKTTRQRWGSAEVVATERTWVALHQDHLVMATSEPLARKVLADDSGGGSAQREWKNATDTVFSLRFTGHALEDILSGGQPVRARVLNAVQALSVDIVSDGSALHARLSTPDRPAAQSLLAPLQKFLDQFNHAVVQPGHDRPPELTAQVEGNDVVLSANLGKRAINGFAATLAMRLSHSRARPSPH